MTFKSLFRFRRSSSDNAAAGSGIIFLMMSLVFVPIAAAHLAVAWHDLYGEGPQRLASIVDLLLPAF